MPAATRNDSKTRGRSSCRTRTWRSKEVVMSDFVSNGWSLFVGAAPVLGLPLCRALLIIASRRKVMAADNSTGHVWDEDIRELNNPLPRWWMVLFVLTVHREDHRQPAASLVEGLGRADGGLVGALSGAVSGFGRLRRSAGLVEHRPIRGRAGQGPRGHADDLRQVRRAAGGNRGQGSAGDGHRRTPVRQQLRQIGR